MFLFGYTLLSVILILLIPKKHLKLSFSHIFLIAFVVRIVVTLIFLTSSSEDIQTFIRDGQYLLDRSPKYDASYFPFISYLGAASILAKSFIHPYIFLKLIFTCFDVGILLLIYYLSKKNLQSVLIYALNPISIIVTNVHGQMDAIPMFFFLSGLVLFLKNQILSSILTMSFAVYTKPWPILFVIPLIKKSNKKLLFILLAFFPIILTLIHSAIFPTLVVEIFSKVKNHRGIFGAWGISKALLYLTHYQLSANFETWLRRFFLTSFIIFSFLQNDKKTLKNILMSMLFLFAFSPTFGIQWFAWLVPFVILVRPKFWRVFILLGSLYLSFGFVWDADQYFRNIMPFWNSVVTRVGFCVWIFMVFMFFKNSKTTSQKL